MDWSDQLLRKATKRAASFRVVRGRSQPGRVQRGDRLLDERVAAPLGSVEAKQSHQRGLAALGVLAGALAERCGAPSASRISSAT